MSHSTHSKKIKPISYISYAKKPASLMKKLTTSLMELCLMGKERIWLKKDLGSTHNIWQNEKP